MGYTLQSSRIVPKICITYFPIFFGILVGVISTVFLIIVSIKPIPKYIIDEDCGIYGTWHVDICICRNGWSGSRCDMFLDDEVWSNITYIAGDTDGEIFSIVASLEECLDACEISSICAGIMWEGDNCIGIGPHLPLTIPFYELGYMPYNDTINILRKKNRVDCWGYPCYYNSTYGLIWIDEINYAQALNSRLELTIYGIVLWNGWQDMMFANMHNYSAFTDLGHVLEINVSPYLQIKRIVYNTNIQTSSISIANVFGSYMQYLNMSDYFALTEANISYTIEPVDFSIDVLPLTIQRFDTIILPAVFYGRKNLAILLQNVYNILKKDGLLIIEGRYWEYINDKVLTNICMGAGMLKKPFLDKYTSLFREISYVEQNATVSPSFLESEQSFPYQESVCWQYDPFLAIHPLHRKIQFTYVGRKK